MAAYAGYLPIAQTRYLLQGLFSEEKFAQLLATGVLNMTNVGQDVILKGDSINIPQAISIDDLSDVDLTLPGSPPSPTRGTTNNAKAPILRKAITMTATEHDNIRTGENWLQMFAYSAGNKFAKDILINLNAMLQGVINVAALAHLYDASGIAGATGTSGKTGVTGAMTVNALRAAKKLLGDQMQHVDTCLINSMVWADLLWDLQNTYKYSGSMSGGWIENMDFQSLMGIKSFIVSDDMVPVGTTESSGSLYYTWLFKKPAGTPDGALGGPIIFGYQAAPRFDMFHDGRFTSSQDTYKWNHDYVLGVRGMHFGGSATPPSQTDMATQGNWTVTSNDTRNVGVIGIKTTGGLD